MEKGMATHSSIPAWRIHRQRCLAGYSPWGQRVRHNWGTVTFFQISCHTRRGLVCLFYIYLFPIYSLACCACLVISDSLRHHELYSSWNSPGQNTGVGSLSLLQEIFPTEGPNPGLPHCRWILYQRSHKGSNKTLSTIGSFDLLSHWSPCNNFKGRQVIFVKGVDLRLRTNGRSLSQRKE